MHMANYVKAGAVGQYAFTHIGTNQAHQTGQRPQQKTQVVLTGDPSYTQSSVNTDAQVLRPHANEILTINNTGQAVKNHPFGSQVIQLVESQRLSNAIQSSPSKAMPAPQAYFSNQGSKPGYRPFEDLIHIQNHQHQNQNIVMRQIQKMPLLNGPAPTTNIINGLVRNPSSTKGEPPQQVTRSTSGYHSNTSRNFRGESPMIIGSKAFDALIQSSHLHTHPNRSTSGESRQHIKSIEKISNNGSKSFANPNVPPRPNHSNQNTRNYALPKDIKMPPIPGKPKMQKTQSDQMKDQSRRLKTEVGNLQDTQVPTSEHGTSQNNINIIPQAPSIASTQFINTDRSKQSISNEKSPGRPNPQTQINETKSPQDIKYSPAVQPNQTASPTPMDKMKGSMEAIKQPVTAFSFSRPEDLASKLSPVHSLFDLHNNKIPEGKDYMSHGLHYFFANKRASYSDSINNPNQNVINTSIQSNMNGSATSSTTGIFSSNVLNGQINNASSANQTGIVKGILHNPQIPNSPKDQLINSKPGNFEHPLAVRTNVKLQRTQQPDDKQIQKKPKPDYNSMTKPRTVQPVTQISNQTVTIGDALQLLSVPLIQVMEYMPEKGVQVPEDDNRHFNAQMFIRKDFVDRQVQWQSRIGCPDNGLTLQSLECRIHSGDTLKRLASYETNQIEPTEIEQNIEMRYNTDQSLQVNLNEIEYAIHREEAVPVEVQKPQESTVKIQSTSSIASKPLAHKNSLLEAGLKLIYGDEGTKKYEEFLRKMEERDNAANQQATKVPETVKQNQTTPQPTTTTTTISNNSNSEKQKLVKKESNQAPKQSEPRMVDKSEDKHEEVFDRYVQSHSNRHIQEYPSRKDIPESNSQQVQSIYVKVPDNNTDVNLDYLKGKYGTHVDQTICRYDMHYEYMSKVPNQGDSKKVFNHDNDKTYKQEITSVKTISEHTYIQNPPSANNIKPQITHKSRSSSKTLLNNIPKMLSYEDLRMKLQRDESDLLKGYRQNY